MDKIRVRSILSRAARARGYEVQIREKQGSSDTIRVMNASTSRIVVAGTFQIDSSRRGYEVSDVIKTLSQITSAKVLPTNSYRSASRTCKTNASMYGYPGANYDYWGDEENDFYQEVMGMVEEILSDNNLYSEPSVQAGFGTDAILDLNTNETVVEIDFLRRNSLLLGVVDMSEWSNEVLQIWGCSSSRTTLENFLHSFGIYDLSECSQADFELMLEAEDKIAFRKLLKTLSRRF